MYSLYDQLGNRNNQEPEVKLRLKLTRTRRWQAAYLRQLRLGAEVHSSSIRRNRTEPEPESNCG